MPSLRNGGILYQVQNTKMENNVERDTISKKHTRRGKFSGNTRLHKVERETISKVKDEEILVIIQYYISQKNHIIRITEEYIDC